jgi:hypothetical protein
MSDPLPGLPPFGVHEWGKENERLNENIFREPDSYSPSPNCVLQLGEAREGVECISAPHRKSLAVQNNCTAT